MYLRFPINFVLYFKAVSDVSLKKKSGLVVHIVCDLIFHLCIFLSQNDFLSPMSLLLDSSLSRSSLIASSSLGRHYYYLLNVFAAYLTLELLYVARHIVAQKPVWSSG